MQLLNIIFFGLDDFSGSFGKSDGAITVDSDIILDLDISRTGAKIICHIFQFIRLRFSERNLIRATLRAIQEVSISTTQDDRSAIKIHANTLAGISHTI